jgi:hypothetical protein
MNIAKLAVLSGAIVLASGGIGAALAESRSSSAGVKPIEIEARKNDGDDDGVLMFAGDDDDDDDTRGNDGTGGGDNTRDNTNGTSGATGVDASGIEGRSAAEWMASAKLYKERWLQMKKANERHAQQVRNLRAARSQVRSQVRSSAGPRTARSGGNVIRSGGGGTNTGGGGTNTGGGSVSGGGDT